jgi:hypothetical protein
MPLAYEGESIADAIYQRYLAALLFDANASGIGTFAELEQRLLTHDPSQ